MGITTIVALYVLILVGGIVRSTGAGMGCPDWPKCFGSWVPPTSEEELPIDYVEQMIAQRKAKNERVQRTLQKLGMDYTFSEDNDHMLYEETLFNLPKAWIEYVNRLIGVLIGFFIFLSTLLSLRFLKIKGQRRVFFWTFAALVLVMVQGFLGSIVVSTNLLPGMITWHMVLAIVIVACVTYAVFYARVKQANGVSSQRIALNLLTVVTLAITMTQLILGTQIRESIDQLKAAGVGREAWLGELGVAFFVHRSFSWLVLLSNGILIFRLLKSSFDLKWVVYGLGGMILIEFFSGLSMALFGMPAVMQPVHLLLATLAVGFQFIILLELNKNRIVQRKQRAEGGALA